jgi:uncharacterized membrane protein
MDAPPDHRPSTGRTLLLVVVAGVVIGVLDAIWLTVVAGPFYDAQIGHLLAESPNAGAALAFYVVYVLGLVHFVIRPGLVRGSMTRALANAAAFGVVTYATFDLTSMAVMRDFPLVVVLVDMAWGALLCTLTTGAALAVVGALDRRRGVPVER